MQIEISITEPSSMPADFERQVDSRIWFCLGRFSSAIERVACQIARAAGGGYACHVHVHLEQIQSPIAADAVTTDPVEALTACVDRCRRTVERRLHLKTI